MVLCTPKPIGARGLSFGTGPAVSGLRFSSGCLRFWVEDSGPEVRVSGFGWGVLGFRV